MNNFDPYKQRTVAEIREDLRAIEELYEKTLSPQIEYLRSMLVYWSCFQNGDHSLARAKFATKGSRATQPLMDTHRHDLTHITRCLGQLISDNKKGLFRRPSRQDIIKRLEYIQGDIFNFDRNVQEAGKAIRRDMHEVSRREGFYSAVRTASADMYHALGALRPNLLVDYRDRFRRTRSRYRLDEVFMTDTDDLIIIGKWYDGTTVKAYKDVIARFTLKVDGLREEAEQLFPANEHYPNNYTDGKPVKPT